MVEIQLTTSPYPLAPSWAPLLLHRTFGQLENIAHMHRNHACTLMWACAYTHTHACTHACQTYVRTHTLKECMHPHNICTPVQHKWYSQHTPSIMRSNSSLVNLFLKVSAVRTQVWTGWLQITQCSACMMSCGGNCSWGITLLHTTYTFSYYSTDTQQGVESETSDSRWMWQVYSRKELLW